MKTKLVFLIMLGALACAFTGCASRTIESAATKIKVGDAEIQLAKNIDAESIKFTYDPVTKEIKFEAAKIKSDASGVIQTAGQAQAEAIGKLTETVTVLAERMLPVPK
jgi:PBP1b-binding outer membrane lipoprotein LpoB